MRCILLVLGIACIAAAAIADEPVPLNKLPKQVVDELKAKFPNASLTSAHKTKSDGQVVLEVAIKEGGKKLQVKITPLGAIQHIEREIGEKELPAAVAAAIAKKAAKATVRTVWAGHILKDGKESLDYYWVELQTVAKRSLELEFDLEGTLLQVVRELTAKDLPKAVGDAIRAKYPKAELASIEGYFTVEDGKETPESFWVEVHVGKKVVDLELLPDGTIESESTRN